MPSKGRTDLRAQNGGRSEHRVEDEDSTVEVVVVVLAREPDGAEHLQRPLAHPTRVAASEAFDDGVEAGGAARSRATAAWATADTASHSVVAHASRWRTAWKVPMGCPNCSRSTAWASARASAPSAAPSISSDDAMRPRNWLRARQRFGIPSGITAVRRPGSTSTSCSGKRPATSTGRSSTAPRARSATPCPGRSISSWSATGSPTSSVTSPRGATRD